MKTETTYLKYYRLAQPGGNITGMGSEEGQPDGGPGLTAKQLELLKDAVPTVSRVAMLFGQRLPTREAGEQARERAAPVLGLTLRHFYVQRPEEFTASVFPAITADAQAIDALYARGGVTFEARQQLADFALQHRLPMMGGSSREQAEAGSLLSYGVSQAAMWRRTAHYVDKILKGTKPADLPVEQPITFELVINLKTAQALGLTIPPTLLFQATEVIR